MGKIKELPEAICEMETEVKSVQLDNEFFFMILFTVLIVQTRLVCTPLVGSNITDNINIYRPIYEKLYAKSHC